MGDDIRNCRDLDERLTPFVDGEDTPAEHGAVGAHLAACPPCRESADAERSARDMVHEHRASLSARAPGALRARCLAAAASTRPPVSVFRKWAPLSVAATLVLAIAGVFVFGLNNRVEALAASLAIDHVKCFKVSATDAHADASAAGRQWQQDQGWPLVIPAAAAAEQLQLVDVRRCLSTDGRTAHMMYKWRGAPLSLYVVPQDTGREQIVRKVGHRAIIWSANRRTYAVVAGDEALEDDLSRVVSYLKAHVR